MAGFLVKQFVERAYVIAAGIMGLSWVLSAGLVFLIPREEVAFAGEEEETASSSSVEDID